MLAVRKYVVSVEMSHDVADNYMFKHLTADAGKNKTQESTRKHNLSVSFYS